VFGVTARDGWTPLYNETDPFHETFTTLAFLAAATRTIGLSSGILILPQRQTGLVAKQAAEVDILSGGRLRLGIGVGWNPVEYEALGAEWKTRGARQAEQVEVLRRLWTEDLVTFKGRFHDLHEVAIVPRPRQRPIPIWFGGSSDAVVKRAARIGDGYMPIMKPDVAEPKLALLFETMKQHGRDPAKFGLEGWLRFDEPDPQAWAKAAEGWKRLGARIVMLYPMYRMAKLDDQIATLRRFKEVAANI
jgi:probable F420-dependent oxidoreductase